MNMKYFSTTINQRYFLWYYSEANGHEYILMLGLNFADKGNAL